MDKKRIKKEEPALWKFLGRTVQALGTARAETYAAPSLSCLWVSGEQEERERHDGGGRGGQPRPFCTGKSCADGLYFKWSELTVSACLFVILKARVWHGILCSSWTLSCGLRLLECDFWLCPVEAEWSWTYSSLSLLKPLPVKWK